MPRRLEFEHSGARIAFRDLNAFGRSLVTGPWSQGRVNGRGSTPFDPRPRRRHRAAAAELRRGPARTTQDGRGGRAGDREQDAPDGRGGDGGRQELRVPRAGDPGGGGGEKEGGRVDAHDQPAGTAPSEGHPVPPRRDAAGVLGGPGQGAVELHQLAATRRRGGPSGGDVPEGRGVRTAHEDPPLGRSDGRREPVGPRFQAAAERLGRGRQRE